MQKATYTEVLMKQQEELRKNTVSKDWQKMSDTLLRIVNYAKIQNLLGKALTDL